MHCNGSSCPPCWFTCSNACQFLVKSSNRSQVNKEEHVRCQVRANETYSEAKRQFSSRNMDVVMNAQSPHKSWSTLKSAVFSLSLSLPLTDCWWRWWTGVRIGWLGWSALGSFWCQADQRVYCSAPHLPSVSETYHHCLQNKWGLVSLIRHGPLWGHRPIEYVSSFS